MNKENIVSTTIMIIVSLLMIIGFTVAWYTGNQENATVSGMQMVAGDRGDIKIALTSKGDDIFVLKTNDVVGDEYVSVGLEELTNVEGKLAPGAFGEATFYLTPESDKACSCLIVPKVGILVNGEYYLGEGSVSGNDIGGYSSEELYEIIERHIVFYKDEQMTEKLGKDEAIRIEWTEQECIDGQMPEKAVSVYWQWYYEYPFTQEEENILTKEEKDLKLKDYDEEDNIIGNNISNMKFVFRFSVE